MNKCWGNPTSLWSLVFGDEGDLSLAFKGAAVSCCSSTSRVTQAELGGNSNSRKPDCVDTARDLWGSEVGGPCSPVEVTARGRLQWVKALATQA